MGPGRSSAQPPKSIMPLHRSPSAAARTAVLSQDSTGTASPQQPLRTAAIGNWHGWLSCLPSRHRKTPELSPLSKLSPDLPQEVVKRTADAGPPPTRARQLAVLRPVNKAFRDSADKSQQKEPAVHRAASEQRLADAIREAVNEVREGRRTLDSYGGQSGTAARRREKKHNEKLEEIKARLAAVVHSLDPVIVDLRDFQHDDWLADVFQDALSAHPGNPTLEISANEGLMMMRMTRLLDARPQLLRSLVLRRVKYGGGPGYRTCQAKLSPVLAGQTNLAALRLENRGHSDTPPKDLGIGGFDQAIASLPSLKSFAMCGYAFGSNSDMPEFQATTLLGILRKLPALEELDLNDTGWGLEGFTQFVSTLPALPRLQRLDLSDIALAGSAGRTMHECVKLLAPVLPDLANLHTLDLTNHTEPLDPEDCSRLTASLARAPALKHLHLPVPIQPCAPGSSQGKQLDPATLISILDPLAERQGLHIHMPHLDDARLALMQEALPALRISNE